ncbi:MAG TPA: lamin tail domain-containing protein [Candidatus Acidoferrales bacterium]|nr:lamin tail domain-containing protein [Candidatus Acidoferrales bacterium]
MAPDAEWIELYNATDKIIDLSGFRVETHGGSDKIKSGSIIGPGEFAVLCKDSSVSVLHYPVKNLIIQSTPSQNNSGDWMVVYDNQGNLLDSMSYVPSYGGANGRSLERIDCFAGNDSANWHESVDSTGATPGMINSVAKLLYDVCLKRLSCKVAIDVNDHADIDLMVQNDGRNLLSTIDASIDILNDDGKLIFSDRQLLNVTLKPGDSVSANFVFTPAQSGACKILAQIHQPQDQRPWNDTLSTWTNVCYRPQDIGINEIMYTSGMMGEYFEICNASQNPIDITNWAFYTSSETKPIHLSAVQKVLPYNNYFVIAADTSILNFVTDTSLVLITKSMTLRDNGGYIVLEDPSCTLIDSVYYTPSWHNSDIANTSGRSLEKINPMLPSNEKTSWSTCVSQNGGTPGKKNSIFMDAGNIAGSGSISVAPNPFSPDGDGVNDFTFINYSFQSSSVKVRVRIFDSIGRLIATPVDNTILPSSGKIVWDGRDNSGKIVRFGLYILFVEVTGSDGKSLSRYKTPLVVAKRMR